MIRYSFSPFDRHACTLHIHRQTAELLVRTERETGLFSPLTLPLIPIDNLQTRARWSTICFFSSGHDENRMQWNKNSLTLDMEAETVDYLAHQMCLFLEKGFFFPAEFSSFVDEKSQKKLRLYWQSESI